MQIIKSLGEGIGTAAGVAWPTFGLVFGTLGLTIGASSTLLLASIAFGLFFTVALPITYWSYKNYVKEHRQMDEALEELKKASSQLVFNYLLSLSKELSLENKINTGKELKSEELMNLLRNRIKVSLATDELPADLVGTLRTVCHETKTNDFLKRFVSLISDSNFKAASGLKRRDRLVTDIRHQLMYQYHQMPKSLLSNKAQIKAGIMGFTAAFGSIAGCSAGTIGLLSGVGVFSGVAAVPIVGWTALAAAVIFGITVAAICVTTSYQTSLKKQHVNHLRAFNHVLTNKITSIDARLDGAIATMRLLQSERLADNAKQIGYGCEMPSYTKLFYRPKVITASSCGELIKHQPEAKHQSFAAAH